MACIKEEPKPALMDRNKTPITGEIELCDSNLGV